MLRSQSFRASALFPLIVATATVVAYIPVFRAGFTWDDDSYLLNNKTLRSAQGLRQIWLEPRRTPQYYPMVHTSFWVEYHLWALRPLGYHVVNVVLQIVNSLLLWRVLARLGVPGARWVALLFAIHPVQVETVAWSAEPKNLLAFTFALLTVLAWLRFWPLDATAPLRWSWFPLALLLFVCALLSKTITCTLAPVLLILAWWKRDKITWRDWAATAPLFALGLASGLFTAWLEKNRVGAEGQEWSLGFIVRLMLSGRIAWFYLWKDLWPRTLIFIYPRWQIDEAKWWNLCYTVAAGLAVAFLWVLRKRIGRAPAALAAIYLVTLFPAMGFFNV